MTRKTDDKRLKIMQGVLSQVPFDGWTDAAYGRGLQKAKLSQSEAQLLFPQGLRDVIEFFAEQVDAAMLADIARQPRFARMRTPDKIAAAIQARLEFLQLHREAMRRLLIWYALPSHVPLALKRMYRTVDVIWRAAGDTATDFNFYTKRLLLAAVLKATILFWLSDESKDCADTWTFLDRRLDNVAAFGKTVSLAKEWLPRAMKAARG